MTVDPLLARTCAPTLALLATVATLATLLCASLFVAPASTAAGEIVTLDAQSTLITVQRNHSEADTMLDALRDDVYKAVLWGARGQSEHSAHIHEVKREFAEHAQNLKARIEANSKLGIDAGLRSRLKALQHSLDAYLRSAQELIAVAGDQEKAVSKLDGFQNAFEALQKAMNTVGDLIDGYVWQRKQALEQHTRFSQPTILGMALICIVSIVILITLVFIRRRSPTSAQTRPYPAR